MIDDLRPYPSMRDSGVPWLGDVPEHWETRRLRHATELLVSNVDKKTAEDEEPVRLCNYVDVYKNDAIHPDMPFMRATASKNEIKIFRVRRSDVLITKDSEDWRDIGIPAWVSDEAPDLVCGYHLAILRPIASLMNGRYLYWQMLSPSVRIQFSVRANGVTRYGLSHGAIKEVVLAVPSLSEQSAIIRFLDHADRRIRCYVRAKRKLIRLLEEQKRAIIHQAVTRGLAPDVPLKPSGLKWLGDVPAHWEVRPAKFFYRETDERSAMGSEELLSVSHITGVTPRRQKNVTMFMAESYAGHKLCRPGDLVINTMWAWMAALGVARQVGIVSPAYGVYRPLRNSALLDEYADLLLKSQPYVSEYNCRSTGVQSSRLRLYPEQFLRIRLVCPPTEEQKAIVRYLETATADLSRAIATAKREIDLLNEYRTRLIADVVTGKLDVRAAAAGLPDETEESGLPDDTEIEAEDDAEPADELAEADG